MPDFADDASSAAEAHLANCLGRVTGVMSGRQAVASAMECQQCGEPIPEARRNAVPGCQFCIECQRQLE